MPKSIKGNAGRKPPEPLASHDDIDAWYERLMPHLRPVVEALDAAIRGSVPDAQFGLKGKRPYYGLPDLGTTDRTRYVEVTSLEGAQDPQLLDWLQQTRRTPGWR